MDIASRRAFSVCVAATLVVGSRTVRAQSCFGTPANGGISYDRGANFSGSSNGATATLAGRRVAGSVGARVHEKTPRVSTQSGDARFSLQFGVARVAVCPGLGVGYRHTVLEIPPTNGVDRSITTHAVAARAGVNAGMEQPVYGGVTVTPFVGVRYAFRVYYLDSKVSSGAVSASGDTVSSVEFAYGLTVRYSLLYLGWSSVHDTNTPGTHPTESRVLLGVTWGADNRKKKP